MRVNITTHSNCHCVPNLIIRGSKDYFYYVRSQLIFAVNQLVIRE